MSEVRGLQASIILVSASATRYGWRIPAAGLSAKKNAEQI